MRIVPHPFATAPGGVAYLLLLSCLWLTSAARADSPAVGHAFESVEAGLSLMLPPGEVQTAASARPPEDPQVLAVVTNAADDWRFELRSVPLDRPVPLRSQDLPEGGRQAGLLEVTATDLQQRFNGDLLRLDLAPLPDADAGLLAVRYSLGPVTLLRQDALIRASDTLYYRLSMTSPAPQGEPAELQADPTVRRAVSAFNAAFSSFRTVDQSALREEQEQRLIRTRSMLVNLRPRGRLAAACAGEQWWAVRQNGETVGFAHVIEEPADSLPVDAFGAFTDATRPGSNDAIAAAGVRVGVRLRMRAGEDGSPQFIDRASWSYASRGLDVGDFREANVLHDGEGGQQSVVIGQMRSRRVPVRGDDVARGPGLGASPTFELVDRAELEVVFTLDGHPLGEPLTRNLPAFYVPRAVDHLLPRLAATWGGGAHGYMVAVYVPERREVFSKYIDVAAPEEVTLPAGGRGRCIVVTTRLGYGGRETRHFIDPNTFAWLGSSTPATATQIFPVTREYLAEHLGGDPLWETATDRANPLRVVGDVPPAAAGR